MMTEESGVATPENRIFKSELKIYGLDFLEAARFEPVTAWWDTRMLPLCCAITVYK